MYLKNKHFDNVLELENIDPNEFEHFERLSSKAVLFSTGTKVLIVYVDTIVFKRINNQVILNTNGWKTFTSKKWINYGLDNFISDKYYRYIKQEKFKWYLITSEYKNDKYNIIDKVDYNDNMIINLI